MHEIVVVEAYKYPKGTGVFKDILEWKNDLWWFDQPDMTLEKAVFITGAKLEYAPHMGEPIDEVIMNCDAIRFTLHFCPDPNVPHFGPEGALHCEFVHARNTEMFNDDLPKFAAIVNRKLSTDDDDPWRSTKFYALYEVEYDEYRDDDGGLDSVDVYPTFIGELDLAKIAAELTAQE